ncbi:hypothetical protein BGW80DRAFT_1452006 [Lactifluus volemus]|nr:hypothetical protein BGW80DRAFT_1452006 [Lactifluus volemus]
MVSRHVFELCTSPKTLIAALAEDPDQPVSKLVKRLFKSRCTRIMQRPNDPLHGSPDQFDVVAKPFVISKQIYNDVLHTLDTNPLAGLVSPPLLGSSGVIPLSVISVIPDIMRHYANLIVRAEAEIILATNYWEASLSSSIIADSLRELSKRVRARGGEKVVMKLMYDRGNLRQAVKNRIIVDPVYWSRIGLPSEDEIPGISLEVVNYHHPLLGTFHAKYLVVDRRVACLNSNNVQDRPNIEMMVHLEGPIVESIYDMALLTWSSAMNPPLPLLTKPPTYIDPEAMSEATRSYFQGQRAGNEAQPNAHSLTQRCDRMNHVTADEERGDLISEHSSMQAPSPSSRVNLGDRGEIGSGLENQRSEMEEMHLNTAVLPNACANPRVTTPNVVGTNTASRPSESDNPGRDEDHAQANLLEKPDTCSIGVGSGSTSIEAGLLPDMRAFDGQGTAQECGEEDMLSDFRPYILHEPHNPVPIAMVNRSPTGRPGHYHVLQHPQDVAWLSAVRYAQKSVFIQTPTFNASPIVAGTLDACRRGVQVTLYLDLGFNDLGEAIPFQGGTNEEVVHKMYNTLNSEENGAEKHLEVFWYTAKDQTKPLNAALKKRNCHVKFMAVDDEIAILGNGNQDTQSWFHSQEANIMVDSPELVSAWQRALDANQNTRLYGRVSDSDGVWRGEDGEVIQASGVTASSFVKRLKGLGNLIGRVRGTGGF